MKTYHVYIITNKPYGVLYIGFTNELERRIFEHKNQIYDGFSARYNLKKLVYYEDFKSSYKAFLRERQLKKWKRKWKIKLIDEFNPDWKDLSEDWYD